VAAHAATSEMGHQVATALEVPHPSARYSGVPVASYIDTARLRERGSRSGKPDRYSRVESRQEPTINPRAAAKSRATWSAFAPSLWALALTKMTAAYTAYCPSGIAGICRP